MKRKRLLLAVLTPLLLLSGAWTMTMLTPSWYDPLEADNPTAEAASERVEFRVQQEFQRIRTDAPQWTLRLPDDVANAWLATRLQAWLRGQDVQWPDGVGTPQVRCRHGVVEVAATMEALNGRICRLDLVPSVDSAGVMLTPGWAALGVLPLPLPAPLILSDDLPIPLLDAPAAATIDLIDDRRVRITAIRPVSGALEIDLMTSGPAVP
jgi:hypothetical protein